MVQRRTIGKCGLCKGDVDEIDAQYICCVVRGNAQAACPMQLAKVIDHPSHYGGDVPHEVVKCLAAWGLESDALLWNAVKYIARHKHKGDTLTDLRKAEWYLLRRIVQLEKETELPDK